MNAQLFRDLPEQREGPITVDGRTLVACPDCEGVGATTGSGLGDPQDTEDCTTCNGGGVVLVRA